MAPNDTRSEHERQTEIADSRQLAARRRLAGCVLGWGLLAAASPGIVAPAGSWALALGGVAVWGAVASRPGRRAWRVEWLAAALGWAVIFSWSAYVFWGATVYMAASKALYLVAAGGLLRRLARRWRLALAVPAAWLALETLCAVLPPPFGMPWMRLGTHLHDVPFLAGSARVWGIGGLSLVLAACAGLAAEVFVARHLSARAAFAGLLPALVAVLASTLTAPPAMRPGPQLLLVQPGVPQARKQRSGDPLALLREQVEQTARALDGLAGDPPDIVAWGETMLHFPLMGSGLRAAFEQDGLEPQPWLVIVREAREVDAWRDLERHWVADVLTSGRDEDPRRRRVLPHGTSFVSGAELLVPHAGRARRQNAVLVWNPDGTRGGAPDGGERVGAKMFLAPSGETMLGLERFAWVRAAIFELAGYVPDLLAAEHTETLWFEARDGRRYAFGASICYDNAFDAPYLGPTRRGALDFHLVFSNEAWFRTSLEMDQMVAFSRLAAIQSGRALVRVTNSGVTCAFDAGGRELARLVADGRDRAVAGNLEVRVPVPAQEPDRSVATIYARSEKLWILLWLVWGPFLALSGRRKER